MSTKSLNRRIAAMACGALAIASCAATWAVPASLQADGSAAHPLRVMLIPADGGTEDGTKADYQPVFNAVTRMTNLHFDIKVGQSYGVVVEGMCDHLVDVAFFGPATYVQAHDRGCAQLLAVAVEHGASIYYAGFFANASAKLTGIADVKNRRVAFGDINSASSFVFPVAMLMAANIDPVRDLAAVRLTGSHANSIAALGQGLVDVAALSFDSYEKAVRQGVVDPNRIKIVARSGPIPYPPLAMSTQLPAAMKARLKDAFDHVATAPGVTREMVRGYGGGIVDRYDANFPEEQFARAGAQMSVVTDALKAEILKKAAQR